MIFCLHHSALDGVDHLIRLLSSEPSSFFFLVHHSSFETCCSRLPSPLPPSSCGGATFSRFHLSSEVSFFSVPFVFGHQRQQTKLSLLRQKEEGPCFEPSTSSKLVYEADTNPQDHDALTSNTNLTYLYNK